MGLTGATCRYAAPWAGQRQAEQPGPTETRLASVSPFGPLSPKTDASGK